MTKNTAQKKKKDHLNPVYTGIKNNKAPSLQLFTYNNEKYEEDADFSEKNFKGFPDLTKQYWLNIHGIQDVEQIKSICGKLGIHNLAIQDILDVKQRPKFQQYENYLFFSIKSILPSKKMGIELEQLSFILGKNFLVSFQERKADYFKDIRTRIRENEGALRERTADFLLFLLLDAILENYFETIDDIEQKVENFGLIDINIDPSPSVLRTIERYKRQLHMIKKTIVPIKEFVVKIEREKMDLIQQKHIKYFLELQDLCLILLDNCDSLDLRLESNINLFFSVQGHRMNQIMKILTIVATIFIPMTFFAGVYGMNFKYMPELETRWGYYVVWLVFITIFVVMMLYFKKKKWY